MPELSLSSRRRVEPAHMQILAVLTLQLRTVWRNANPWLQRIAGLNAEIESSGCFVSCFVAMYAQERWTWLNNIQTCLRSVLQLYLLPMSLYQGSICMTFLGRREIISLKWCG